MRFTAARLERRAKLRPSGFKAAVLARAREVSPGLYELDASALAELRKKWSPVGLGDLVARVANPIAAWHDKAVNRIPRRIARCLPGWLVMHWEGCQACSARRRALNALVGDIRRLRAWWDLLAVPIRRLRARLRQR